MTKDLQGSSHHLKLVGEAYGKRKDFIYEEFMIIISVAILIVAIVNSKNK